MGRQRQITQDPHHNTKGKLMAVADNMPRDTAADMGRRFADIERKLRELSAARTLDRASITATPGAGIRTADFDGTDFAHPGTAGNYFGGDGAVLNSLYLRPGSVANDWLTSPVVPGIAREVATNFALTAGTLVEKAGTDLVVPDGCTRLLCTATGRLYAVNTHTTGGADGTGTDALYVALKLGTGSATLATPTGISGNGGFATTTTAESYSLSGLTPGSTLRLGVYGACGYVNFAANVDNRVSYAATLIWLR